MPSQNPELNTQPYPSIAENVAIAASLAVISAETYLAERVKLPDGLIEPFTSTLNSAAHPSIGFTAGLICILAMKGNLHPITKTKVAVGAAAATALNFGTEIAQEVILNPKKSFWIPENRFETLKDWGFAIGGLALAYAINKNRGKDKDGE